MQRMRSAGAVIARHTITSGAIRAVFVGKRKASASSGAIGGGDTSASTCASAGGGVSCAAAEEAASALGCGLEDATA